MEEVRQLVQEEGREARNLVAFHVAVDPPSRVSRKPPRAGPPPRRPTPRPAAARLRSASAGRDKRSELRARYWALLFGDLQRAIGEIYNTVEAHESLSECQEVILVLENYTRDFKALCEWFRLKWELDNTPPPQRPLSLAWEIRKTDFVRPESRRAYSVKSSPSVSGKNSPCLSGTNTPSGKNSPNLTGKASPGSGKISPRNTGVSNVTSPKANVEFFSNKITAKITAKPEPKTILELSRLSDIKEKEGNNISEDINVTNNDVDRKIVEEDQSNSCPAVEIGKAKECPNTCPKMVVIKSPKHTVLPKDGVHSTEDNVSNQAKATIAKLEAMESEFLTKNLAESTAKNENLLNIDKEIEGIKKNEVVQSGNLNDKLDDKNATDDKESTTTESPVKSEDNFADVSNESSCKSLENEEKVQPKDETLKEDHEIETGSGSLVGEDASILKVIETNQDPENLVSAEMKSSSNNSNAESVKDSNNKEELKDNTQNEIKEVKKDIKTVSEKIPTRPAYSQAAAKPKPIIVPKPEPKNQTRLARSKTVVEIRSTSSQKPLNRNDPRSRNKTNKCSYPFNLTTGRTSLFDTPNKANLSKKPVNRMQQIGSGDNKNPLKHDTHVRSRPPRPTSLKINEKGDKKDNSNIALENIKDCDEYGSSDTLVTEINVCRIESSESLKTLVPDGGDVGDFSEILDIDKIKNDDDGWLTVKSRRLSRESKKQSKSHWGNRFHQPSATTSLPTLNMIESPKQEIKEIIASSKLDRAKSEQPQHIPPQKPSTSQKTFQPPKELKGTKTRVVPRLDEVISKQCDTPQDVAKPQETIEPKETLKSNGFPKAKSEVRDSKKDLAMIRQKSDVTGLKTRSSRSKALKKEKVKDTPKSDGSELTKNRLHSSLESLTTGLARSQESTQEIFDFDKWKEEFKTTFKFLEDDDQMPNHNEILKSADPSEMSEIAEMTSLIEENERKISWALDFQSEVDQRKLCEEEDLLNRQIMELQQVSDVDLDTETDDTETDAEILCEDKSVSKSPSTENLTSLTASLEDQYETALAGMSWAERVDTLGALEALVARDPGRAQQLHAKLSQGIKRRGSLQDALRRLQAKQARAERQRIEYQTERARKIHQLLAKVEEVKVAKNQLIEEKRLRMERRLQKAAENRDQHLKDIVRKAHDEEEKLREIAFIKQLEAENRRHEFLDQCRSHTSRLRLMRRDRLSKLEQKAAREAAVGARRQALEAARKLHVETLLEKRKERDARVEELKELKKQERDDAAREKAEGVKSRLSALAAAASQEADALRERIRDKQDASQLRLESHLQAIREKATGPRQATTSESQDQFSKEEKELQEEAERLEQERKEREKQKAIKRKARKMKQKLLITSCDDIDEKDTVTEPKHPQAVRMSKVINQIQYTISPLISSYENENKTNGCDLDEPEKKKNKKNKKIISDADKEPVSNSNNKEIETKSETNSNNKKDEKKLDTNDNNKKVEKKLESNVNKTVEKKPETNDNDKEIETQPEPNSNNNKKGDSKPKSNSNNNKENQEETKSEGKKKKKKNDKGDRSKLSKSGSICSSHSDMSKASAKGERLRCVIDMQHFERQLNELLRIIEKFEKTTNTVLVTKEKSELQNVKVVKVVGGFLGVAADREDFGVHVSTRSVHTSVALLARLVSVCARNSARLLSGAGAVHLIVLLYKQIEKGMSDPKEMDVVKELTECLSVALDSVLSATRAYVSRAGDPPENAGALAALRARAHNLISFLCLSGCVSIAENSANLIAMDGMHNLLTVCGNLCHACDLDVGPERASASQSFKCSLGTSICGARGLFCMLFAQGVVLEKSEHFVRAARTIHLLKTVAELDHQIIQESFGEGGWPLEFRAAVARLLSQHAPNDKEAPRTRIRWHDERLEENLVETMVLDLIVLVGFVVVNNPQLQETICEGWSVIKTLCTLPANWLVSRYHSHMLVPTLVALSQHKGAAAAIAQELSTKILDDYMKCPLGNRIKLVQVIKQARPKKGKK